MPAQKHSLRDLAASVERLCREHPAWSYTGAREVITSATNHLSALARILEMHQDEARPTQTLRFSYVNYRGSFSWRTVNPISVRWGTSEWYETPQWLLMCYDMDKKDRREFALANMHEISQLDQHS